VIEVVLLLILYFIVLPAKRDYVRKLGGHPIVYNSSVFEARDQSQAREEFERLSRVYLFSRI